MVHTLSQWRSQDMQKEKEIKKNWKEMYMQMFVIG